MPKKRFTRRTFESVITFNQYMVQGLWKDDDPLLQLPHFDHKVIKAYKKQLRDFGIPSGSIQEFVKLSPETRKKLNLFDGDAKKDNDVEQVVKVMPRCKCTFRAFVENQDTMHASDLITLEIKCVYENVAEDSQPGYMHSIRYPYLKRQSIYAVATDFETKERVILNTKMMARKSDV